MKKAVKLFFIGLVSLILLLPIKILWAKNLPVAKLFLTNKQKTEESYELKRNGKIIKTQNQEIDLFNGDILIPKKDVTLTVKYRHTRCGEKQISDISKIMCDLTKFKEPGFIQVIFSDLLSEIKRKKLIPRAATIKRGQGQDDYSCFPEADFHLLSPWPPNGSSFMYGSPILFRWEDLENFEIAPCTPAILVIASLGENKTNKIRKNIKVGELVSVSAVFEPGHSYQWHIEMDGLQVTSKIHFQVLKMKETNNIKTQLAKVTQHSTLECLHLEQALYLQLLSQALPKTNLNAESLGVMRKSKTCRDKSALFFKLSERLIE